MVAFTYDAFAGTGTRTGALTIAGFPVTVAQAGTNYLGPGPVMTLASALGGPYGVAVDVSGNVYIADSNSNSVKEWSVATQQVTTLVSPGLNSPFGVAVDGSGNVYIADTGNGLIKEWSAATQQVTTLLSTGLNSPKGVAVDASGSVYIADTGNNAIKEMPYAFVGPASPTEAAAAGSDSLRPMIPVTMSLAGIFAPSSDQNWLTIGTIAGAVVSFSFTANTSTSARVAHISLLGQQITVTQIGLPGQTIAFGALSNQTFGAAPFTVSATASSGLTVSFNSQTTSVCTVSGSQVTLAAGGLCTILATQAGNAGYAAAAPVAQSFTVNPASQTITFNSPTNVTYGVSPVTLNATASSGLTVVYASTTTSVCAASGSALTILAAGTCSITVSQVGNASYQAATPVTQTFTIAAGSQTVTFGALNAVTYGVSPFTLSATASSGLAVTYASNSTLVCTVAGSTVTVVGGGTCSITANQAGNANYAAATSVTQTFTVNPASQTITFAQPASAQISTSAVTISATASSGLAVSFASNSTSICTVSGSSVTLVAVGTCSITASQGGNTNYSAATAVTRNFSVTLTSQTITFGALSAVTYGVSPITIGATASSGLAVSFASNSTTVCTVSGNTVTIAGGGTCSITASQAGNATYAAAAPVTQAFAVYPASQTITFTQPNNVALSASPLTLSATASSGLAVSYSSNSTLICTVSGSSVTLVTVGTCSITASQAGNATYAAAASVTQAFQVAQASQTILFAALSAHALGSSFPVSATASSGLPVSFTSQTPAVCTVTGATVTMASDGTCAIQAAQAGNANYSAATPVVQSFQVTGNLLAAASVAAGPGRAFNIPITLTLASGASVDSLTFGLQIAPVGSAPALTGSLSFTPDSSITDTPFAKANGTTNAISVIWASLSSPLNGARALGVVSGTIPATAVIGQSYTIAVTGASATYNSTLVLLGAGTSGTLAVSPTYLVGDVYPYTSDMAPNFGDGTLDIRDLIQLLFAANNIPGFLPAACSDRFDAMDSYPADTATARGGDGMLDIRDLILLLFRVNNLDPARPVRASRGGVCALSGSAGATELDAVRRNGGLRPATRIASSGRLALGAAERMTDGTERAPVYLEATVDLSRVAVTFGLGDQRSQLRFAAADGLAPSLLQDTQLGVVAAAWMDGVSVRGGERLLLGYVTGPAGALANVQFYGVSAGGLDDNREVRLDAPITPGAAK